MKDRKTIVWVYQYSKAQLFPLLALIFANALSAFCGILFALAARGVIDKATEGEKNVLILQSTGLLAVIVLQFILRILCRSLNVRIQGRLEMDCKSKLLSQLLCKDYIRMAEYHSGELMNRLTGDITVVCEGITGILPDLAGLLTRLIGALIVLCVFDPAFTLAFIFGGILLFLTAGYFRTKLKYLHKNVQEKDGIARSFLQELLESLVVVKSFGAERKMEAKAAKLLEEHYKAKLKKNTVSILANSGFSFLFSIGYLYAIVWGAFGMISKTISFGTLTAVLQLVSQVQMPFAGLSGLFPKYYSVIASVERLIELESLPDEIELNKQEISVAEVYRNMRSLVLSEISFRYDRDIVINNTGLSIEKGDFILVSGPSGIGKSTIFKLLLGVLLPTNGSIYITLNNGETIPIDRHTRRLFAYVPQGNQLLSGTIRESIALVLQEATDTQIMSAAKLSCADEFILGLPHGLDTVIGEKGLGLSEGQVQRLAIARAVLCGAPILLLDEATSALDEATEKRVLQNIRQLADRTCIVISHKKAAFSLCNKEIRLRNGRLQTIERKDLS